MTEPLPLPLYQLNNCHWTTLPHCYSLPNYHPTTATAAHCHCHIHCHCHCHPQVPRDTPGLSVGPKEDKLGIRSSSTCPVTLEGVQVGKEAVLGETGVGYKWVWQWPGGTVGKRRLMRSFWWLFHRQSGSVVVAVRLPNSHIDSPPNTHF
jgi:hypothetical protein